jgi:hypothetical protein
MIKMFETFVVFFHNIFLLFSFLVEKKDYGVATQYFVFLSQGKKYWVVVQFLF